MIQIVSAKKRGRTVLRDGDYLMSRFDPEREMERVGGDIAGAGRFFLLFGSGLGGLPKALEKAGVPKEDILVYEPEAALAEDLGRTDPFLFQYSPGQGISELIENRISARKRPFVFGLDAWIRHYPERYAAFRDHAAAQIRIAAENLKVTLYFSKVWFVNMIRNLGNALNAESPGKRYYPDAIVPVTDCPVVVAASGPSLDRHLEQIAARREDVILIAVLSACRTLSRAGVDPDLVVFSDAGVSNILHASRLKDGIPVLANVYANGALLSRLRNPVVYYNMREELGRMSFQLQYPSVTVDAGLIASRMTTGPVIFCGFDLAYHIRSGSHSSSNALWELRDNRRNRLNARTRVLSDFLCRDDVSVLENPSDGSGGMWFTQRHFRMIAGLADSCFSGSGFLPGGTPFPSLKKLESLEMIPERPKSAAGRKTEEIGKLLAAPDVTARHARAFMATVGREFLAADSALAERIFLRESISGSDRNTVKKYYGEKIRRISGIR